MANAELRIPFTGPERLALIKSKWLFTDLNLFMDSGLAWNRGDKIGFTQNLMKGLTRNTDSRFSVRVHLYGSTSSVFVLEPYYAFPLQNARFRNGVFGLNFTPGW